MSRIRGPKDYGEKDMLGKPTKRKSIFSGPLFPKGTGGLFPKYDAGLRKKQANVEADLPTSRVNTKGGFSTVKNPEKNLDKPGVAKTKKADKKPKSFSEAFKMAKGQKTFTYKGKSYARVTKDEMEKSGFKSLRAYLNAQKTTRVAKK
jgi:hypothetical protein